MGCCLLVVAVRFLLSRQCLRDVPDIDIQEGDTWSTPNPDVHVVKRSNYVNGDLFAGLDCLVISEVVGSWP